MTKVIYYTATSGEDPVSDFLDQLAQNQQAKLLRIVSYIEQYGLFAAKISGFQAGDEANC